jgi:Zn finger protein HypA/HybF involved in hydrogenase expression
MKMTCNDCKRPHDVDVVHEGYCPNCGSYDIDTNTTNQGIAEIIEYLRAN